ncbi:MAG: hypothetical protein ACHREM_27395, partial [Polyangiales bacterium]
MSRWWYTKLFLIVALGISAFVVTWPSVSVMTGGKLKCPIWIQNHVPYRINRGLDLRGGLRLVYTVQVDEAIRDKRDRYADELRQKIATNLDLHKGDAPLSQEEQKTVSAKVLVERPEHNRIVFKFTDAADIPKAIGNERGDKLGELVMQELIHLPSSDPKLAVFKIRTDVETAIRERAVGQAKKTVENRVDELGLREVSLTTRDEDIILEVPGEDDKVFGEIEQIVSQTARLEFKILDDDADFFGKLDEAAHPLPEGSSVQTENAPVGLNPQGGAKYAPSHFLRMVKKPEESLADTGKRLKAWAATAGIPDDHQLAWGQATDPNTNKPLPDAIRTYYVYRRADVTGEYITDAMVAAEQNKGPGNEWYVALTFSPAGADKF